MPTTPTLLVRKPNSNEVSLFPIYSYLAQDRGKRVVYYVKRLPTGVVLAYDRHYDLLGLVETADEVVGALAQRYGVDTWPSYSGGSDRSVGDATWLEVK